MVSDVWITFVNVFKISQNGLVENLIETTRIIQW